MRFFEKMQDEFLEKFIFGQGYGTIRWNAQTPGKMGIVFTAQSRLAFFTITG